MLSGHGAEDLLRPRRQTPRRQGPGNPTDVGGGWADVGRAVSDNLESTLIKSPSGRVAGRKRPLADDPEFGGQLGVERTKQARSTPARSPMRRAPGWASQQDADDAVPETAGNARPRPYESSWGESPKRPTRGPDRYIPDRQMANPELQQLAVTTPGHKENAATGQTQKQRDFQDYMAENLLGGVADGPAASPILPFRLRTAPGASPSAEARGPSTIAPSAAACGASTASATASILWANLDGTSAAASLRARSTKVKQISCHLELDLPGLVDDYYLNLLAWSSTNIVAVALLCDVYLYDVGAASASPLFKKQTVSENQVCSLVWNRDGTVLAVGLADGSVEMWCVETRRELRRVVGAHQSRVSVLSFNAAHGFLSSGSRDGTVTNQDLRSRQAVLSRMQAHASEICGLTWSPAGSMLASGSNDNECKVWDAAVFGVGHRPSRGGSPAGSPNGPLHQFAHSRSAVRALAWCPWSPSLLAAGGGTADQHIRFYDSDTGLLLRSVRTDSQVCSLQWSPHHRELVSAHGYLQNLLSVWKYPTLEKTAELAGHRRRVLHTALSPDGTTVCSAGADEALRFWTVWELPVAGPPRTDLRGCSSPFRTSIR